MKADRIGLVVTLASLSAIAAICVLLFSDRNEQELADVRARGIGLVRALAAVPFDELVPGGRQSGALQIMRHSAAGDGFAYVAVVDAAGNSVGEVTADAVNVPAAAMPIAPAEWLGEAPRKLPASGQDILEFYAPLLKDGELTGFVRLGFERPGATLSMEQLPFLAMIALPVFLLVPLFYWLLRSEIRPIRAANAEIERALDGRPFQQLQISASGELADFLQRLNRFAQVTMQRIDTLDQQHQHVETSNKLLEYRKSRVETVLETLPEALMILDESGAITFANEKLAAMFGVPVNTILTQPPQSWCENADVLQLLAKYQDGNKTRSFTDTIRFHFDAVISKPIATKTFPLFSPKNPKDAIGTLIVFRDETQEAAARQARTDFVAHLAHELKSPLNVLAMYSESLLSEAGNDGEFRIEAANVIGEEVDRLSTLINGLLNMTKIETGSLKPELGIARLQDIAAAAFEEAKTFPTPHELSYSFDAPREIGPAFVDKDLIRIAVTNLLSNAVKYNQDGGEVLLKLVETEDAFQIRVADSGIGISEDEEAKIFSKFFRSEDPRIQSIGGHGLGLALARQVIELHHGSLTIDREREQGTEFIINLWKEFSTIKQAI